MIKEQKNTDRELWVENPDDYYSPRLFVTEGGGIGMDVGGHVIVMPIRRWHALALIDELDIQRMENEGGPAP